MNLFDLGRQMVPNLFSAKEPSVREQIREHERTTRERHTLVTASSANVDESHEMPAAYRDKFRVQPRPVGSAFDDPRLSSASQKAMQERARARYGPK